MTAEGISAIAIALFAAGGYIYSLGANNYRFTETGKKSEEEDKRIREEMAKMEQRIRGDCEIRISSLLRDINGIGQANRSLRTLSDQRYHNSTLVHLSNTPPARQLAVAGMLREEVRD